MEKIILEKNDCSRTPREQEYFIGIHNNLERLEVRRLFDFARKNKLFDTDLVPYISSNKFKAYLYTKQINMFNDESYYDRKTKALHFYSLKTFLLEDLLKIRYMEFKRLEVLQVKKAFLKGYKGRELVKYINKIKAYQKLDETNKAEDMEGYLTLNINTLLSKYYKKEISVKLGENCPKLSKQLKKYGVKMTEKESSNFGECINILGNFTNAAYLDLNDFSLPIGDSINNWAFRGSCNSIGGVGQFTSEALDTATNRGVEFLKIYLYDYGYFIPYGRAYSIVNGNDFGHSGAYLDFYNGELNHTSYELVNILLCILHDRKLDEVYKLSDGIEDLPHSEGGVWCNMHDEADYAKFGTVENILSGAEFSYDGDYIYYSENLDRYINTEEETEFIYCENIEDYEHEENTSSCAYCENTIATDAYGVIYSNNVSEYFCDEECAHRYITA